MNEDNEQNNIVYILTNEAMPGYIKIGYTTRNPVERARELDSTGIPLPFEVHYACRVEHQSDEMWLHKIFADDRVRDGREFFKMDPERVVIALKRIQLKEIMVNNELTTEQSTEVSENKIRRSGFSFNAYSIDVGSEIYFSRDESKKAVVLENNKIKINGEEVSLSSSAKSLLGVAYPVAGPDYWMYDGETLTARRSRMDQLNTT